MSNTSSGSGMQHCPVLALALNEQSGRLLATTTLEGDDTRLQALRLADKDNLAN